MEAILVNVPKEFYKNKAFFLNEEELRAFLKPMIGFIGHMGEELDSIDIEKTINMHSGDCRIWYKHGCYDVLDATQIIMKADGNSYADIFEWMKINVPSLYDKHKKYK